MVALRHLTDLVVIDEVQRRPDLFPILRVLADRNPLPARFLKKESEKGVRDQLIPCFLNIKRRRSLYAYPFFLANAFLTKSS
jgi:hypothetical protein